MSVTWGLSKALFILTVTTTVYSEEGFWLEHLSICWVRVVRREEVEWFFLEKRIWGFKCGRRIFSKTLERVHNRETGL